MTHSAIAFELEGGWRDVKGSVAATVLQYLLGGGGSFSSGGPGEASDPSSWMSHSFCRPMALKESCFLQTHLLNGSSFLWVDLSR